MKLTPEELAAATDAETARRLMVQWGGHRIPQPTARRVARETRDAAIRADLDAGRTYRDTATRHGVSIFTVWQAAKGAASR